MKILVADDDLNIRKLVSLITTHRGHDTALASDGEEAIRAFSEVKPDLVILDVMMPKIDGFETCRRIRALDSHVPVLFLSAKGDVVDRKEGLRAGADDYLEKPFDEEELLLRMNALLRRSGALRQNQESLNEEDVFSTGRFLFDKKRLICTKDGTDTRLTVKEFQIFLLLASRPHEVVSVRDIVADVWGEEYLHDDISIPVYMRRIRSKIEDDPSVPQYIKTVRGSGYRFEL